MMRQGKAPVIVIDIDVADGGAGILVVTATDVLVIDVTTGRSAWEIPVVGNDVVSTAIGPDSELQRRRPGPSLVQRGTRRARRGRPQGAATRPAEREPRLKAAVGDHFGGDLPVEGAGHLDPGHVVEGRTVVAIEADDQRQGVTGAAADHQPGQLQREVGVVAVDDEADQANLGRGQRLLVVVAVSGSPELLEQPQRGLAASVLARGAVLVGQFS